MSRRGWVGVMLFAVVATVGAVSVIINQLHEKQTQVVPLMEIPAKPVEEKPVTEAAVPEAPVNLPPPTGENEPEVEKRNILFTLHRPNAKKIKLLGDFNNWTGEAMKKENNIWKRAVALEPGTYRYLFEIDGRKVRDPNNKTSSSDGKSLLNVKPLPPSSN